MSIVYIRAALETALNGMSPSVSIAPENVPFTPVSGTPYQQCFLLNAEPDNSTVGDASFIAQGIFQVNLMYPLQTGSNSAATRAEMIRTTFKRGNTFTSNGIRVVISNTPEIGTGIVDGDRWNLPVKVRFFAQILS